MISITDGQIYLQGDLFFQGQRPAVDVGISVSRVGGAAQVKGMKRVAGNLRLDLANYREMQSFAQFGSDLDDATRQQLARGARMTELLKQGRYAALDVADQIAVIYAGSHGFMDDLDVEQILPFRAGLVDYLQSTCHDLRDKMRVSKLDADMTKQLEGAIASYKKRFVADAESGSDAQEK